VLNSLPIRRMFLRLTAGSIWLSVLCASVANCLAIEPGYYRDDPTAEEIASIEKNADRKVYCYDWDMVRNDPQLIRKGDHREVITCADLRQILAHDRKKGLLVIILEKGVAADSNRRQAVADKYASLAEPLGYRRILVLGAKDVGVWVFKDIKK
jgi:hypothetical protein